MTKLPNIAERIRGAPLVFDGAMGTMIYQRGVFLNACYDELCLTQPQLIRGIHEEYVAAGADVIETNSFGANRLKLAAYGLADRVGDINRAAARLAREAAGESVFVAASVGPCFDPGQDLLEGDIRRMEEALEEQFAALAAEGVDLIALETFLSVPQLQAAARLARPLGVPILASFTLSSDMADETALRRAEEAGRRLDADQNVDFIGINCGRGPADLFHPVQHLLRHVSKPVIIMPNAGGPREVGGRMLYLNSPEYFTEFCKRFIEVGARAAGGCCGTTPAHIRMAARAVKALSGVKRHLEIALAPAAEAGRAPKPTDALPFAEKSPLAGKLAAGHKVNSVKMLPPPNGGRLAAFLQKCRICQDAGVDAVNLPDGPRASARLSVMATAFVIRKELDVEPIVHYCCRDRNLIGMQSDILGGFALGVNTWLFVTGDPPKLGDYPDATGVFDLDAIGLTRLVNNLNHGFDAAGQSLDQPTAIAIGVGANPAAVEIEREISRFFLKVDAGAEFAFTQPVFDVEALLRFLDRVNRHHRAIPVIAGLYPLLSFRNAEFMNAHVPGVVVPDGILERMRGCKTKEDGLKTGIEIAREIRAKVGDAVAGFQTSAPLGKVEAALAVLG